MAVSPLQTYASRDMVVQYLCPNIYPHLVLAQDLKKVLLRLATICKIKNPDRWDRDFKEVFF